MSARVGIAFVIRSLETSGAERQLVLLARELRARGYRVAVLVWYEGGRLADEARLHGVEVTILGKRHRYDLLRPFVGHLRWLARHRRWVIHPYITGMNGVVTILAMIVGIAPRRGVAWGVRTSGVHLIYPPRRADRWLAALDRALRAMPALVIANSQAGAADLEALGFAPRRVVSVVNAVDTELFVPDRARGKSIRAEVSDDDETLIVGVVGRLDPTKGLDVALAAMARTVTSGPRLRLAVIGRGSNLERERVHQLARSLGLSDVVKIVGEKADMTAAYNALDVLLSASPAEGFPNVVAEAMACGLRCVVTDVGDAADVVDGNGWTAPVGDAGALALALSEALTLVRTDGPVDAEARTSVVERFAPDRLLRRTLAALETANIHVEHI